MQIAGPRVILCPWCGHAYHYHINFGQWRVRCKNRSCRVLMGLGHYIIKLDNPRKARLVIPPDVVVPRVPVAAQSAADGLVQVLDDYPDSRH